MVTLYINNKVVDVEQSAPCLSYNSNLFGEIDKIQQNFSYTIRCLKTANNAAVFGNAATIGVLSPALYSYLPAQLVIDGISVVTGRCVLMSIDEMGYNVNLLWGDLDKLGEMLQADNLLCDEFQDTESSCVIWNKSVAPASLNIGMGFIWYNYGYPYNAELMNIHPTISAYTIFNKLRDKYGLSFIYPTGMSSEFSALQFPCVTKKSVFVDGLNTMLTLSSTSSAQVKQVQTAAPWGNWVVQYPAPALNAQLLSAKEVTSGGVTFNAYESNCDQTVAISFNVNIACMQLNPVPASSIRLFKNVTDFNNNTNYITIPLSQVTESGTTYFRSSMGTYQMTLKKGEKIIPKFMQMDLRGTVNVISNSVSVYTLSVSDPDNIGDIEYPCRFPVYKNLPAIKTSDFFKSVCAMLGVYCTRYPSDAANVVRFVPYSEITTAEVIDLSDKFIRTLRLDYSFNDYAQVNYFQYNDGECKGLLKCDNATLSPEKIAVSVPFDWTVTKPSYYRSNEGISAYAMLPQYDVKGGALEFTELKPRVLKYDSTLKRLTSVGLEMQNVVNNKYSQFKTIISKPKLVEVEVKLFLNDLKNINFSKRIFIKQLGQYFGIVSIQYKGVTSTMKLIKL